MGFNPSEVYFELKDAQGRTSIILFKFKPISQKKKTSFERSWFFDFGRGLFF